MKDKIFDLITFGRSSIDLYSQNIGADFVDIKGFDAFVGGSPLNIAVGASRLGAKASIITGVGNDKIGDFIINFLKKQNVGTDAIPRINGARTSAVILGIEPPDKFPLVYYRDNCADNQVTIDHVIDANISQYKILEISATALSVEPSRSAVFYATEIAQDHGVDVVLDIDFRADQWKDVRSFGLMVRALLPKVKIAIGTEEEILAATLQNAEQISIKHQQISAPEIKGNLDASIQKIISSGPEILIVKRGSKGVSIYYKDGQQQDVPGFPVEVLNVLGAGDAFASGFIYGYLQGWSLYKACRLGNACGAWVVQKPGCANDMPYYKEIMQFADSRGGLMPNEKETFMVH
ncbi:5-dehydro-2-deoxygluconokinase [Chitinophagaceae bacterium LB-8]|uniref:5-dehydro-2-deoxygluconokinase n=1 Tax=Paraflavisolibacter caeni TaxID=2982496 RepID=A0A9X2XVN2_9BACT|nr:5-dehydro-2-deoxygluconokinase [Paraflavisolibacter caeni]MCU7549432.1 5-dehydro-2-deoxygluconokinase [Paraflavisolibacter caeni]